MQAYSSKLYWTQKGRIASARGTASCPTHGCIRLSRTHEPHEEGGGAEEPAGALGTAATRCLPDAGQAVARLAPQLIAAELGSSLPTFLIRTNATMQQRKSVLVAY